MTFNNKLLLAILSFSFWQCAQAREVELMRFDQSAAQIGAADIVETEIRSYMQSIGRPRVQAELTSSYGMLRRMSSLRRPTARWSQKEPPTLAHSFQSTCATDGYAPAWWLPLKVEIRRSVHFASMASIACEFGVPISLLDAVIAQESGYNPWAVSRAGAMGMMQIMPGTARSLGLNTPFDPVSSMRAGARYLRQQIERFGRIDLALAAYNAGPERRSLAVGYVPAIPETVNYVQTVSRNWARLAAAASANDLRAERAIAASNAVLAAGYRGVELSRYNGMNAENPI